MKTPSQIAAPYQKKIAELELRKLKTPLGTSAYCNLCMRIGYHYRALADELRERGFTVKPEKRTRKKN